MAKVPSMEMIMAVETLEDRFAAYVEVLTSTLAHVDRKAPFSAYCRGLIVPGERKSVEPPRPSLTAAASQTD
jgi:SRSO17 transposase